MNFDFSPIGKKDINAQIEKEVTVIDSGNDEEVVKAEKIEK